MLLSLIPSNHESIKGLTVLIRKESLESYRLMSLEVQRRQTEKYSFIVSRCFSVQPGLRSKLTLRSFQRVRLQTHKSPLCCF